MTYDEIAHILSTLRDTHGWEPINENDKIIGVQLNNQSVTLEPGGQFELSGAPVTNIHQTYKEAEAHLQLVKSISAKLGCGFIGLGFDPKWKLSDVPTMPKGRYHLMKQYMPTVGTKGLDMMFRTCTVQVNLDFESEKDMVEKFRIGLALQPIANALFANSPFKEGQLSGYLSARGNVWTDVDKSRTGNLPFVFSPDMSFESYVDYAMDVPMYFVYRNGTYINALGQSWRDFMQGKLPALPGEFPSIADWANHLTTIFPEVRLKRFLEMRGADSGSLDKICALSAFWVGLLYDPTAQQESLQLIKDWSAAERETLFQTVPIKSLATPFRNDKVAAVAKTAVQISKDGLKRRGLGEEKYLEPLEEILSSGKTQAEVLREKFLGEWNGRVEPVYDFAKY